VAKTANKAKRADRANGDGFQWAVPEGLEVPPDRLEVRLDVYGSVMVLHDYGRTASSQDGDQAVVTRVVSPIDVTRALMAQARLSSGLLPEETFWWGQVRDQEVVGLYRPLQVWKAALQVAPLEPARRFRLPMPGLVFFCISQQAPWLWAVKRRPESLEDAVYHVPAFNIFERGKACPGSHHFPKGVGTVPESFWLAHFTTAEGRGRSQKHGDHLLALWEELDRTDTYPVEDLVEAGQLGQVLEHLER
jgi:hypothetical protein